MKKETGHKIPPFLHGGDNKIPLHLRRDSNQREVNLACPKKRFNKQNIFFFEVKKVSL